MTVAFGDFELDPAQFELRRLGRRIPLEPQAFDVLCYLVQHRDRVVSKEELMDQIWGGRFVTEAAVSSQIKQARRAVGDDGRAQSVITTVHGRGYRFVSVVRTDPPEQNATGNQPELVGRSAELATLDQLVADARAGRGRMVVVTGEPGIGKSALLAAAHARVAAGGGRVLVGRGAENRGPFRPLAEALLGLWRSADIREAEALRPFRHALDRVLPGWVPGPGERPEDLGVDPVLLIAEGLVQILSGVDTEFGVLTIDDGQDADPDTVAVLEHLAAVAGRRPVLILLARSDWPRSVGLDRISAARETVRMPLSRIAPEDLRTLVTAVADLPEDAVASIVQRSEGLPVVAVELAAASDATAGLNRAVPEGFAALVEARILALEETDRRLLAAAAVFGGDPDWDLVPTIAGVDDVAAAAGLRNAVRLHVLASDGGHLRWRHGLIQQVVWAMLLPPERRTVTQAAVRVLLGRAAGPDAARAADLMTKIGEVDGAVDLWLGLTRAAIISGGFRTAAGLLDRVEATGRRRVAAAVERVGLLAVTGEPVAALEAGWPALDEARGAEHAELCLRLARAAGAAGRWAETEQLVTRAGRADDPRSAILLSDAAHATGRMAEAEHYAVGAVDRARADHRRIDVLCEALCSYARCRRPYDLAAAQRLFAEAAQLASEYGLLPWRVEAMFGLATIQLLLTEQPPELLEVRRIAFDAGLLGRAAQADLLLADQVLIRDGPAGSAEPATRVAEFGRLARVNYFRFAGEALLATRSALAGDERAMEYRLGRLDVGADLPPDIRTQLLGVRGQAALVRHDLATAADLLNAAVRPMIDHAAAAPFVLFGVWALVETLLRTDPPDFRAVLAGQTASWRRANRGAFRYADAVIAGRSGDRSGAEAALADGDELLAPTPWWQRFLRTFTLESAVIQGWANAVPRLRVDLAAFETAGEEAMARLVRDLLRRAGSPTRRGRGNSDVPIGLRAVGVTSREVDVLRLVQEGLTNPEIAMRLYLSPRTVETHVTNLLMKSGAANRGELAIWAALQAPGSTERRTPEVR